MKRILLTILIAALALPALAYHDKVTHKQMSIVSAKKSVLYTDPNIMYNLDLLSANRQQFIYYGRNGNIRSGLNRFSLDAFVAEGSIDEDADERAKHHFFDPVYNRPIVPLGFSKMSWQWMVEEEPIGDQHRSIRDARDWLTRALTHNDGSAAESQQLRGQYIATMFLSLGHTMHHMQDMAQPQHVRHDQHYDGSGAWYLYPLINKSRYEEYTKDKGPGLVDDKGAAASPVFPGSLDFQTPRDFWFNGADTGIAEKVNHDFVSQGTNFTMSLFGNPLTGIYANPTPGGPTDYSVGSLYAEAGAAVPPGIQTLCGNTAIDCTMTMYSTAVSTRASTRSIFDQDMVAKGVTVVYVPFVGEQYITRRLFDLNRFNFDNVHPELIKRAVSYSSGIVNHFFRGKLWVNPPVNGPYAVADHAAGEGFRQIKAEIQNATENEALPGGTVRAIVKFHRNGCYQPDLSGEVQLVNGQLVPACPNYRSPEVHIRVSEEQSLSLGIDEWKQMTFTFEEPIPFDATDVFLQVYYTGQVGQQAESFALGASDISEPTFTSIQNATDLFELGGVFYYPADIIANIAVPPYSTADLDDNKIYTVPPDVPVEPRAMSYEIYVNGAKIGDAPAMPAGRFSRFVTLLDPNEGLQLDMIARDGVFNVRRLSSFPARLFQFYGNSNQFLITPVGKLRDLFQYNSTTWHRFFPQATAGVDSMVKSVVANAEVLHPMQMSGQSALAPVNDFAASMKVFGAMRANTFGKMFGMQEPESQSVIQPQPSADPVALVPAGPAGVTSVEAIPAQ